MAEDTGLVREVTGAEKVRGYVQMVMQIVGMVVAAGVVDQTEAIHYAKWPILIGVGVLVLISFGSSFLTPMWKAWKTHVNVPSQPQSANVVLAQKAADKARKAGRSPIPPVRDIRPPDTF